MPVEGIAVSAMRGSDLDELVNADGGAWWQRDRSIWLARLDSQDSGMMHVAIGRQGADLVGYGYLSFESVCPFFRERDIPEIGDLRVAERCRRRGVAAAMIGYFECLAISRGASQIGLGVGLYADYGAAQRLYARLGYVPDGRGMTYQHAPVAGGATVRADDDLLLWLVKSLRAAPQK